MTVLATLRERGPLSRADLAESIGLSKPTVGSTLRAFGAIGVTRESGRTTGRRGPGAALYELVPDAALVMGVDIGAHFLRAVLADLRGATVAEAALPLSRPHAHAVLEDLASLWKDEAPVQQRIELAVVGSPGVVDPVTGRVSAAPHIDEWEGLIAEKVLANAIGHPVRVENDVNLAAVGEQVAGAGTSADSFAFLNVGSGLGAGIVLHGALHRGARGAAGEVGFMPVGDLRVSADSLVGPMEQRLSGSALAVQAAALAPECRTSLRPPYEARALFDAARAGDELGRSVVNYVADEVARCVAGLTSVLDLELVLVGGGIGANTDLLLPEIEGSLAELVPAPPRVAAAALGRQAVCTGAVALGLDALMPVLIDRAAAVGPDGGPLADVAAEKR